MFEIPSPQMRPALTIAFGLNPTPLRCGSEPE
jgi:hypothetical protein